MRIPVVESSQQKIIHIEKLMITKALPIPVVTPFSYLQGNWPYLSLLFYSTLRLRSPGAAGQVEYTKL